MKLNIRDFTIHETNTIKEALQVTDRSLGIAFVTDTESVLKGLVTDGDIRRAALQGIPLDAPVNRIMNRNYIYLIEGTDPVHLQADNLRKISTIPVIDNQGVLIDYLSPGDFRPKTALITGITGQDGAYLARFLLDKGYRVIGGYRRSSTDPFERLYRLDVFDRIDLLPLDLTDLHSIIAIIEKTEPAEIYNLAAQSFVDYSFYAPYSTSLVTGLGTLNILEAIRKTSTRIRFYQASTSEMYGNSDEVPQSETTPFKPNSPYATAKLYSHWICNNYRHGYGIHASSGILFNHESPLRGLEFVTRKITHAAARIKLGLQDTLSLGNLDTKRDWGYAEDYVEAMWLMLQQDEPDDYVIATGETHSVREFLHITFELAGLDVERHVRIDPKYFRPLDVYQLCGDSGKAQKNLTWNPRRTTFKQLIKIMYEADLSLLGREQQATQPIYAQPA